MRDRGTLIAEASKLTLDQRAETWVERVARSAAVRGEDRGRREVAGPVAPGGFGKRSTPSSPTGSGSAHRTAFVPPNGSGWQATCTPTQRRTCRALAAAARRICRLRDSVRQGGFGTVVCAGTSLDTSTLLKYLCLWRQDVVARSQWAGSVTRGARLRDAARM